MQGYSGMRCTVCRLHVEGPFRPGQADLIRPPGVATLKDDCLAFGSSSMSSKQCPQDSYIAHTLLLKMPITSPVHI